MGQEKRPDFVMTADGELVPTDSITSDDLAETKPKKGTELPPFPSQARPVAKPPPPPPLPAADLPRAAPIQAAALPPPLPPAELARVAPPLQPVVPPPRAAPPPPPPPQPTPFSALAALAREEGVEVPTPILTAPIASPPVVAPRPAPPANAASIAPPPVAPPPVAPRPIAATAPAPKPAPVKRGPPPPPPADPQEMMQERGWTGERTHPDPNVRGSNDAYAPPPPSALADDLALPQAAPRPAAQAPVQSLWDEDLSSPAEVEELIRDQKYRAVMEQVADIDGDETLEEAGPTASVEIPVIRGTALAPPPARVSGMDPRVTGAGTPQGPAPRRGPPRVALNRTIKEKNRTR